MDKNNNPRMYSISQAADLAGISVHTVRLYERTYLIRPLKKKNRNRLYSQNDINRINWIRNAIKVKKYTIPSLNVIFSLIPCWHVTNCDLEVRNECPAYHNTERPCWSYKNICIECENDCRTCKVYNEYIEAEKIKSIIRENLK